MSSNGNLEQGPRLGALLGHTGAVKGYLPRLRDVLRYTPHLGFRMIARIPGWMLTDAETLRSHLKMSHGVYVETTLSLKQLTEIHECEHQEPSYIWTNRLADHEHEPPEQAVTVSEGFSW